MRHERLTLAALLLLLLAGSAQAAQDGGKARGVHGKAAADESSKALLAERERMKEEYLNMREERRIALESTLVKNVGGGAPEAVNAAIAAADGGPLAAVEGPEVGFDLPPPEDETAAAPTPATEEDHLFLYLVGSGIVIGLVVKLVGPAWINASVFRLRRRRKRTAAGAMTVQLRPRHQRLSGS